MKKTFLVMISLVACLGARAELDQAILLQEDQLIEVLQKADTSDNDRVTACQNLGWCGSSKAVPVLASLLDNEQAFLRHAARYGLEMIPDALVESTLCEAAKRLKGPAREGILQSLGNLKPEQTAKGNYQAIVAVLQDNLGAEDKAFVQAAAHALSKIATVEAMRALKSKLGSCGCITRAYLEGAGKIACKDPSQAASCYADIRAIKGELCPAVRLSALRGEIVTAGEAGLVLWLEALASQDKDTVDVALRVVLDYPEDVKATRVFAEALAKVPAQQKRLSTVLGLRRDRWPVPALLALAVNEKDGCVWSRLAAAQALATLNAPEAMQPLLALAKNEDAELANAAKDQIMGFAGEAADQAVLSMMRDATPAVRLTGIDMAVRRRMAVAVPDMVKLMNDAEASIQNAAIKGVGDLGSANEIPALLAMLKKKPTDENIGSALASLCSRYARPRGGKTVIQSAGYGDFENNLVKDVTENVQRLADAGSITIQASSRLCRKDGFGDDPAPGKPKVLRLTYLFDGEKKSVQVRDNDAVHLSGVILLPVAMDPVKAAYEAATGEEKIALFKVLTGLANEQGLLIARAAANQTADAQLCEMAIRALADWKTPEALEDAEFFSQKAPSDRLKILSLRGFVRQLELSFTIPLEKQIARLEQAQAWAVRDEDKAFLKAALDLTCKLQAEQGFVPIFNGQNLNGWKGGGGWWEVKDGILQAQSSEEKPCKKNSHLIWTGGQPGDFELRAEFRLSPSANSGIQIRSQDAEFGDSGYQADMNGGGNYVGFLYHPKQHLVGERGAKVVIAADGKKTVERFADSAELQKKVFKGDDWNDYAIICKGPSITLYVNGMKTCELEDHRADMPRKGFITLQMHAGPAMKIQYRNLRIKEQK